MDQCDPQIEEIYKIVERFQQRWNYNTLFYSPYFHVSSSALIFAQVLFSYKHIK